MSVSGPVCVSKLEVSSEFVESAIDSAEADEGNLVVVIVSDPVISIESKTGTPRASSSRLHSRSSAEASRVKASLFTLVKFPRTSGISVGVTAGMLWLDETEDDMTLDVTIEEDKVEDTELTSETSVFVPVTEQPTVRCVAVEVVAVSVVRPAPSTRYLT